MEHHTLGSQAAQQKAEVKAFERVILAETQAIAGRLTKSPVDIETLEREKKEAACWRRSLLQILATGVPLTALVAATANF